MRAWRRGSQQRIEPIQFESRDQQAVATADPEPEPAARPLLVLLPSTGGFLTFELHTFADTEGAAGFIEAIAPASLNTVTVFWGLHVPPRADVTLDSGLPTEILVLTRDTVRPDVVYLMSFLDPVTAYSFLRTEVEEGLDLAKVLVYWGVPVSVERDEEGKIRLSPSTQPAPADDWVESSHERLRAGPRVLNTKAVEPEQFNAQDIAETYEARVKETEIPPPAVEPVEITGSIAEPWLEVAGPAAGPKEEVATPTAASEGGIPRSLEGEVTEFPGASVFPGLRVDISSPPGADQDAQVSDSLAGLEVESPAPEERFLQEENQMPFPADIGPAPQAEGKPSVGKFRKKKRDGLASKIAEPLAADQSDLEDTVAKAETQTQHPELDDSRVGAADIKVAPVAGDFDPDDWAEAEPTFAEPLTEEELLVRISAMPEAETEVQVGVSPSASPESSSPAATTEDDENLEDENKKQVEALFAELKRVMERRRRDDQEVEVGGKFGGFESPPGRF